MFTKLCHEVRSLICPKRKTKNRKRGSLAWRKRACAIVYRFRDPKEEDTDVSSSVSSSTSPNQYSHSHSLALGEKPKEDLSAMEVLLISSSNNPGRWTLTGGGIEEGESAEEAAHREVMEEGGVDGELTRKISEHCTKENWTKTTLFAMRLHRIHEEWPESHMRTRKWVPAETAATYLRKQRHQALMRSFLAAMKEHIQEIDVDDEL